MANKKAIDKSYLKTQFENFWALTKEITNNRIKTGTITHDKVAASFDSNIDYTKLKNLPNNTTVTVDSALSSTSTNPVQNKVINSALNSKVNSSSLAEVATSGSYSDLINKPTIPAAISVDNTLSNTSTNPVQNKVIAEELSRCVNTDQLATVATSGEYDDLSGIPTIDASVKKNSTNSVSGGAVYTALGKKADTSSLADVATSGSYDDLTGKPTIPTLPTVDTELNERSSNPISNSAVTEALSYKLSDGALDTYFDTMTTGLKVARSGNIVVLDLQIVSVATLFETSLTYELKSSVTAFNPPNTIYIPSLFTTDDGPMANGVISVYSTGEFGFSFQNPETKELYSAEPGEELPDGLVDTWYVLANGTWAVRTN